MNEDIEIKVRETDILMLKISDIEHIAAVCNRLDELRDFQNYITDKWCDDAYKIVDEIEDKIDYLQKDNKALKDALIRVKDTISNGCYPEFDWLV